MVTLPRRGLDAGGTPVFSTGALPAPQSAAGDQLSQLGRAAQRAGALSFDVVDDLQQQFNRSRIVEADNRAADLFREELGAYLQTRGKDATGDGRRKVFERIQERLRGLAEPLQNEEQASRFWELANDRLVSATWRADAHEAQQIRVDAVGQTTARIKSEHVDAVAAAGTPEYAYHRGVMLQQVGELLDLDGIAEDDPRRRVAELEATTALSDEAVRSLVDAGRTEAAAALLEHAGPEIEPGVRAKLQGLVRDAGQDDQAFDAARWAQEQTGQLLDQIRALDAWVAGGHMDRAVYRKAVAQLEREWDRNRTATFQAKQDALNEAVEWSQAGNELTPTMRQRLKDTNQEWKYEAIREAGGTSPTTEYGRNAWLTMDDQGFLSFGSLQAVKDHFDGQLNGDMMTQFMARARSAYAAAGKAAAQQGDAFEANWKDEALYHYRRFESVPDDFILPEGQRDPEAQARFATWSHNLRVKANQIASQPGAPKSQQEVVRMAADELIHGPKLAKAGTPSMANALAGEAQTGSVELSPRAAKAAGNTHLDLNLVTPQMRQRAREALVIETGLEPDAQAIFDKIAEGFGEANDRRRFQVQQEQGNGWQLIFDRVESAMSDPAYLRQAWQRANTGYGGGNAGPRGNVSRWTGELIEPTQADKEEALAYLLWLEAGKIGDQHGIRRDDVRSFVEQRVNGKLGPWLKGALERMPADQVPDDDPYVDVAAYRAMAARYGEGVTNTATFPTAADIQALPPPPKRETRKPFYPWTPLMGWGSK